MWDRGYLIMEEFGAFIDTDKVDMRQLVYYSDKIVKARNERKAKAIKQPPARKR